MKKEKKKGKVEVNPKYVALLQKSYENFSKIDVIKSSSCREKLKDEKEELNNESRPISRTVVPPKSKSSPSKTNKTAKGGYHVKTSEFGRRMFSEDEDKFILDYLSQNPNIEKQRTLKVTNLAKLMGRTFKSIDNRIRIIQNGKQVKRMNRPFSLTEDEVIIDDAIKHLSKCKLLRETIIEDPRELGRRLKRNYLSVGQRWSVSIRSWLLQYYNKNLNLEVRPMLADFVNTHFDSVYSIDWKFVASQKEFLGHTEISLRMLFHSRSLKYAARNMNKHPNQVTLEEVANFAKSDLFEKHNKVKSNLKRRQIECIDYFVKKIHDENITFLFN